MLLGALAGGLLGGAIGTQRTLIVSASLAFVAALVLWRSPVGRLRKMPAGSPRVRRTVRLCDTAAQGEAGGPIMRHSWPSRLCGTREHVA